MKPAVPEFIRLPQSGTRDPIFGLSRSALNNLILPCAANGFKPPVRSISLKQKYAVRGIRLIYVESLREYLRSLSAPEQSSSPNTNLADQSISGNRPSTTVASSPEAASR